MELFIIFYCNLSKHISVCSCVAGPDREALHAGTEAYLRNGIPNKSKITEIQKIKGVFAISTLLITNVWGF